jgi:hypothetical protein
MAVLFGSVSFDVMATDGTLPFVVTDEDGLEWYTATIKVGIAIGLQRSARLALEDHARPGNGPARGRDHRR